MSFMNMEISPEESVYGQRESSSAIYDDSQTLIICFTASRRNGANPLRTRKLDSALCFRISCFKRIVETT